MSEITLHLTRKQALNLSLTLDAVMDYPDVAETMFLDGRDRAVTERAKRKLDDALRGD